MNSWRPVNALARRIAVSIPSAPELPKKVLLNVPGATAAIFSAHSATAGTW